jgi:hypothetical protein
MWTMAMMNTFLLVLGQLKNLPPDEPRLNADASQTLTMLIGLVLVVGILLVSLRPSKRDRVQE